MTTPGNAGRAKGPCRICIVVSGESFHMEFTPIRRPNAARFSKMMIALVGQAIHLVHASSKDFRESRMRPVFLLHGHTSGSKRGEVTAPPGLRYSTFFPANQPKPMTPWGAYFGSRKDTCQTILRIPVYFSCGTRFLRRFVGSVEYGVRRFGMGCDGNVAHRCSV